MTHNPHQNIKLGNWLLDAFDIERARTSPGGQIAAYATGVFAIALATWALSNYAGRRVALPH